MGAPDVFDFIPINGMSDYRFSLILINFVYENYKKKGVKPDKEHPLPASFPVLYSTVKG
jgi:hypothetical protein